MQNRYGVLKWNLLTVDMFRCPVCRETIKIKVSILWFWSKANVPTQETHRRERSVYEGNASVCYCRPLTLSSPTSVWSLSFFAFSSILPPPPPQPPPDRESSIFIGETHVLFWQWGLRRSERKESSNPLTAKTHYRWENTSDHQLLKPPTPPTLWVWAVVAAAWLDDRSQERC